MKPAVISDYLAQVGPEPFAYGAMDCAQFVGRWVELVRGEHPGSVVGGYRGEDEARAIIRRHGGVRKLARYLVDQNGMVAVDAPRPGDIGVVSIGKRRLAFGIYAGSGKWVVKTDRGLCVAPLKCHEAYAVTAKPGCGAEAVGSMILTAVGVADFAIIGSGATAVTLANVVGTVVLTAASIGLQYGLASLNKPKQESTPGQQTIRESLAGRVRHYGRVKIGGVLVFTESVNGTWFRLIVTGSGRLDAIEQHWMNDTQVFPRETPPNDMLNEPHLTQVHIKYRLGDDDSAVYPELMGYFPGKWTSAHKLNGLSSALVILLDPGQKTFGRYFPTGVPSYRQVVRGVRCFDPRNPAHNVSNPATFAYTENPSIAILDYLTARTSTGRPIGYGISPARVNMQSFAAFADKCDAPTPRKSGGTEPRYRLCGSVSLAAPRKEILREMLAACDAQVYTDSNGLVSIRSGDYVAPTVTLTHDVIRSANWKLGVDATERVNELKPSYTSPAHDYQKIEAGPWQDAASISRDGLNTRTIEMPLVPSHTQAQRLAKIMGRRMNAPRRVTLRCSIGALVAAEEQFVRIVDPIVGVDAPFLVEKFEREYSAEGVSVTIEAVQVDPSDWSWDPETEEGDEAPLPPNTAEPSVPPAVSGLSVTIQRAQVTAGTVVSSLKVTVDPLVDLPWITIAQYRELGVTEWTDMAADGTWGAVSGIVEDGKTYHVRVAHSGAAGASSGTIGAWTSAPDITIVSDTSAPNAPTGLVLTQAAGTPPKTVTVAWTQSSSANAYAAKVYRGATSDFEDATQIGSAFGGPNATLSFTNTAVAAGTYHYFVVTTNASGVASASITASITVS